MNTTNIIGTNEAAARIGVKPVTLRAWRMKGTGPAYVMVSDRACYDADEIDRYAALRNKQATR